LTQETIVDAGNVEASCLSLLERVGFVVTQELNGGDEEWLALRDDLHLRAESPLQLLWLYAMHDQSGGDSNPTNAEVARLLSLVKSR
jgi:hypothetical protein